MSMTGSTPIVAAAMAAALCGLVASCGGGGDGDGGANPAGPSGNTPAIGATVTITSSGMSQQQIRVQAGEAVRFVNNDSVAHVPSSNPHPAHTDCPAINGVGSLQPGASGITLAFSTSRSCGFHDHNNPGDTRFAGQILVGNAVAEPGPGY
jgi:hypothetical protein